MKKKKPLFCLDDGTLVHYGDILWHPDRDKVGWYCIAEFSPRDEADVVTVRTDNGAVPVVKISELRKEPPPAVLRCECCGQVMGR